MGSHVNLGIDYWPVLCDDPQTPTVPIGPISATVGSVILFDVRIRHRGRRNRSPKPRPIMYGGIGREEGRRGATFPIIPHISLNALVFGQHCLRTSPTHMVACIKPTNKD